MGFNQVRGHLTRVCVMSGCDVVLARDGGRCGALVSLHRTGDTGYARAVRTAIVALAFFGIATEVHAQTAAPVDIPLQSQVVLDQGQQNLKLAIYVGINGGVPLPYVFDTGSPVFNAVYNSSWWPGINSSVSSLPGWSSPLPAGQNVQFCLGGSTPGNAVGPGTFCRGYTGNLVQVPSLSFFNPTVSLVTPFATLTTGTGPNNGYVVNAAYNYAGNGGPFSSSIPPLFDFFFGTFGAGNFAKNVQVVGTTWVSPEKGPYTDTGYYAGGVLGQTIVSGATQGYVVAANGQANPVSSVNGPQQVNGINVTIGGQTMQPITNCNPCVTVGLTPQMQGQFWAAMPTLAGNAGVLPWAV